ncbi:MAG: hypothetical protein ACXABG_12165 [Promethearchaeota archaeon]|jgi:hypothetical protein
MDSENRHHNKAIDNYEKANMLWEEGNYESALRYYVKVIEKINDALV